MIGIELVGRSVGRPVNRSIDGSMIHICTAFVAISMLQLQVLNINELSAYRFAKPKLNGALPLWMLCVCLCFQCTSWFIHYRISWHATYSIWKHNIIHQWCKCNIIHIAYTNSRTQIYWIEYYDGLIDWIDFVYLCGIWIDYSVSIDEVTASSRKVH